MKSKLYPISCSAQTQDAEVAQENIWLRFPHFLVAGGVSTALHWSTMAVLVVSGLPGVWATSVGAAAGALTNYWLQKSYVFRCAKAHQRIASLYLVSVVGSWLANLTLFWVLYHWAGINIAYAQVATTSMVCLMNFQIQRRVFS